MNIRKTEQAYTIRC